jgi:hypothetical protein
MRALNMRETGISGCGVVENVTLIKTGVRLCHTMVSSALYAKHRHLKGRWFAQSHGCLQASVTYQIQTPRNLCFEFR